MVRKLKTRGFPQHEIQQTIDTCIHLGYLNDERLADAYLLQLQNKGYGINGIKHKLYAKGIAQEMINASIESRCTDEKELHFCRQALATKLKNFKRRESLGTLRPKLQRFLSGRGFSTQIIYQAINEIIAEEKQDDPIS
jgi:SOS response regulatory protein OraA/RecX